MNYLTKVTEVYRIDTEDETEIFHNKLKADTQFILHSFAYKKKEMKVKGEVIDEWFEVTVQKIFNDPKDPVTQVEVKYEVD